MKFYLLMLIVACFFGTSSQALALTISPTKIEVAGDPGQTIIGEIELLNEESEAKIFYTSAENFEPRGETGSPYFVGGGSGLASWVSTTDSVTMLPGESVTVPYTVVIPSTAEPGGYFAAIFFGSQPAQDSSSGAEVSIGGKVGSLLLLRVNGEVSESGGLLEFKSVDERLIFTGVPVPLSYRFNNTGGDRVIPRGEIIITNTFGRKVAILAANENQGSVLPNSTRRFDVVWTDPLFSDESPASFFGAAKYQLENFHLGLYTADLSLVWGESAQVGNAKVTMVLIPWQLLTIVLGGLVIFIFLLKFYNRMIIARARKE